MIVMYTSRPARRDVFLKKKKTPLELSSYEREREREREREILGCWQMC